MAFHSPSTSPSYAYDNHIEVFMAIRDLELRYGINSRSMGAKIPPSQFKLTMIGFWKPPGALQWVEKCVTETVYKEKNPRYATKMYVNYDAQDAAGVELKFQLLEGDYFGPQKTVFMHTLGYVQTTLSRLLAVGSIGLLTPLEVSDEASLTPASGHKVTSAQCFLRAEVLQPIEDVAIFQFGIRQRQAPSMLFGRKGISYYLEILKINEGTNFEINQPYTLVHRTEPMNSGANCWTPIVLPLVRLCNADWDRVLKLVIYDTTQTFLVDGERVKVGFILTTLRKLLEVVDNNSDPTGRMLSIIKFKDGKESQKMGLMVNQCSIMQPAPFQTYLNNGLAIRRVYAVDFSKSNWNQALHKCNLHESASEHSSASRGSGNSTMTAAPYEQAIEIIAKMMQPLASGQSVFYTFGNPQMRPIVETIEEQNHMKHLFHLFGEALMEAKQSDVLSGEDYSTDQCFQKLTHAQHASGHKKRTTVLAPLLSDLLALLSMRPPSRMEYFVAFIFTDGEFTDLEESMKLVIELAKHPISLVFMAVGLGNLEFPLSLQEGWVHPTTNAFPRRNIVTVIHFRSLQNWFSAIQYGSSFKTDPLVLLQKEIFNAIDKQAVQFLRVAGV